MCALSGELSINLSALAENYRYLNKMTSSGCVIAPAVKADAYGLGMAKVAPVLFDAGARSFFVAMLQEGVKLRRLLPEAEIFVLNGFAGKAGAEYFQNNLVPVLNSVAEMQDYARQGRGRGGRLPCVFHFDTAMNRLGMKGEDIKFLQNNPDMLDGFDLLYVMSHFASADENGRPSIEAQAQRFGEISTLFPGVRRSLANSSGIFRSSSYHLDMVRPGLALYGGNPVPEQDNPMKAVVSLHVPVAQVHSVARGETAGYGESYRFEDNTHVVVVSSGYADGLLRSLSNRGVFYWKDYALPIRGRVSMDLIICDLKNVPEKDFPQRGDMIELLGPHQSVDDLANAAGTISYEILTSLSPRRYSRFYMV